MGHIRQHDERRIEALEAYRAAHGDSAAETGDIPPAALELSRAGSRPARPRARLA
jgi:hypothetical protein